MASVPAVWRIIGLLCVYIALSWPVHASTPSLRCTRCNVLFINLDFLRADYVGLSSSSTATPNIDDYFRNSITFENVYSPAGSSYRGGLSVLTATSPHFYNLDVKTFSILAVHDELGAWRKIYTAPMTIAQILSDHGYHTFNLNKGNRSGKYTFLDRGFDRYQQFPLRLLIEDSIPALIRQINTAAEPFFIQYHAIPTRLHRAFYPVGRDRIEDPDIRYFEYQRQGRPYGYKVISDHGATPERQRLAEHKIYRQQLVYADEVLSSLFRALKKFESDTIIVLFSNHGTQIGDKAIFASNGVSYESSVRVPLLIKHPNVHQRIRVPTPVSLIDLVPTIASMIDVDMSAYTHDGMSLLPVIQTGDYARPYLAGKNDPDEYVWLDNWKLIVKTIPRRNLYKANDRGANRKDYFDNEQTLANRIGFERGFGFLSRGVITDGEWELHIDDRKQYFLYNLSEDPHEERDVSSQFPKMVEKLEEILENEHQKAESRIMEIVKK